MIRSGILVTHPITPNQQSITWKVYYYAGSQRVAMRVAEMPVTQPQPTPTPQPYPAPTPTQSAYQENFFDRFVAFLKDLFDVKAVSAAPLTVDAPVGEVYFLLTDYLGSTTMTVNVNGSVKAETRYGAWGNTRYTTGTTPTERQYTGQIEEEAGLYFYNARWYDSYLNRWLQPDSIVPDPYNILDYDRYSYARNNPVRYLSLIHISEPTRPY
jgi:RHS repeat-associated protein